MKAGFYGWRESFSRVTLVCILVLISIGSCSKNSPVEPKDQSESGPDPYFPNPGDTCEIINYDPLGNCYSHYLGVDITNRGEPGNVFVNAVQEDTDKSYSEVFYMAHEETVTVYVPIPCFKTGIIPVPSIKVVKFTARRALPGDNSDGVLVIERKDED